MAALSDVETLSRVPNWDEMMPAEKERTVHILTKRNQARLERLRGGEGPPEEKSHAE